MPCDFSGKVIIIRAQLVILIYVHDLTVAARNVDGQQCMRGRRYSRWAIATFHGFGDNCNSAVVVRRRKQKSMESVTSTLALCDQRRSSDQISQCYTASARFCHLHHCIHRTKHMQWRDVHGGPLKRRGIILCSPITHDDIAAVSCVADAVVIIQ